MRIKQSRPDSAGQAKLARIESHLRDFSRRAVWLDKPDDYHAFDGALEIVRALQRQSHADALERRRTYKRAYDRHRLLQGRAA